MRIENFSPDINKNEITSHIDKMQEELKKARDIYKKHLMRLFDKIREIKPSTIFFIDRSARPVAWMLKAMWHYLEKSNVINDDKLPDIRFISLDDKHPPNKKAIDEAQKRYVFNKSGPVLIVDEFSESFQGNRGVDFAQKIVGQQLGVDNIETHVFMDRMEVRGIPMLYRIADSVKKQVYGIQDTDNQSIISQRAPRHPELSDEVKRYRTLFKDFGEEVGKDYLKTN